jgi:hypothetical protein
MVSTMVSRSKSRILGDALAAVCGVVFFGLSVGFEKIDPRNVSWLTFGDQQTHWLGWRFFAADSWRWPLGANPTYGWGRMNSIVFTDSFPGLALFFKALNLEVFDNGQYFGIGLLVSAVALFLGGRKLFLRLGLSFWPALLAAAILSTTPLFWWMQRWYPALSSGVPLLVWAFYIYLDKELSSPRLFRRWLALLVAALATQAYLFLAVAGFFAATLIRRFVQNSSERRTLVVGCGVVFFLCTFVMYALGYYTVPSKWAQTGGYGWYSANLLGLIDQNDASRWMPDLPSISGQYEPTALSSGTLIILAILIGSQLIVQKPLGLRVLIREHFPLVGVLGVLLLVSVTNTISFGSTSFKVPLPERLEHALSIFRSSARFVWPTLVVLSVVTIVFVARRIRHTSVLLAAVLLFQVVDYGPEFGTVSSERNGRSSSITFDESFWKRVPSAYEKISTHPAASLGLDWAVCAYAAVETQRIGECGYFSRVQGLEGVNRSQSQALFSGNLDAATVYWVSIGWLQENLGALIDVYSATDTKVFISHKGGVTSDASVLIFPVCEVHDACSFLGDDRETLGQFLREL